MKKVILFLFLFASFFCKAQIINTDSAKYVRYPYSYGTWQPRLITDRGLTPPNDTIYSKFGIATKGTTLYVGNGTKWTAVTGSGSGGSFPDPGSNGGLYRTALDTYVSRVLQGTTNEINITNPDGVAGPPTFSIPASIARTNQVWNLIGNASTNPTTDFVGTTDDQDLVFKRNNLEKSRLVFDGVNILGRIKSDSLIISTTGEQDFTLRHRAIGLPFPVPTLIPTGVGNKNIAFDIIPLGTPPEDSDNGFAWLDILNRGAISSNPPLWAARMGVTSTAAQFGSREFNGAAPKNVELVIGLTKKIELLTNNTANFNIGKITQSQSLAGDYVGYSLLNTNESNSNSDPIFFIGSNIINERFGFIRYNNPSTIRTVSRRENQLEIASNVGATNGIIITAFGSPFRPISLVQGGGTSASESVRLDSLRNLKIGIDGLNWTRYKLEVVGKMRATDSVNFSGLPTGAPVDDIGVDANGNLVKFAVPSGGGGGGDASTNTSTSVDNEIALFSGTTGKLLKRATGNGYAKVTDGVFSSSTTIPNTDITGLATIASSGSATDLTSGTIPPLRFGSGNIPIGSIAATGGTSSDFLRKDGTWSPATGEVNTNTNAGSVNTIAIANTKTGVDNPLKGLHSSYFRVVGNDIMLRLKEDSSSYSYAKNGITYVQDNDSVSHTKWGGDLTENTSINTTGFDLLLKHNTSNFGLQILANGTTIIGEDLGGPSLLFNPVSGASQWSAGAGNLAISLGTRDLIIAGLTNDAAQDRILTQVSGSGKTTYATIGSGLSLSAGVLSATGGGGGEVNTASNLGGGLANFDSKSGVDLRYNTFNATDFDLSTNLISIDATLKSNWNTAFTQTRQWDGGSTGLVAATGRSSLGLVIGTDVLAINGNGSALTNVVHTSGDETVSGIKTFTPLPYLVNASNAQLKGSANQGIQFRSDGTKDIVFFAGDAGTNVEFAMSADRFLIGDAQITWNGGAGAYNAGGNAGVAWVSSNKLKITNASTGYGNLEVADNIYNETSWDGSLEVPTKNSIRDKIESLSSGSGANALGTYIVQTATNAPANAQVMASLGTGLVKNTTATGVQSIAVAGTDYLSPNGNGSALTGLTQSQIANLTTDLSNKQANILMQDEGVGQGASGANITINFTGAGVTATNSGGTLTVNVPGGGGGVSDGDKGDVVVSGSGTVYNVESVNGELQLKGITNLGELTGDIPAATSTGATIIKVSTNSDSRIIAGIAGGIDGRIVKIINTGNTDLNLMTDDGVTGTASNRFDFNRADIVVEPKEVKSFVYDGTLQRWVKENHDYDLDILRRQPMYNWDYMLAGVATANFTTTAVSSGTATYTNGVTDHPGYMQTSSSATANSGNHSYLYNLQNSWLFKGGEVYECIYQPRVASNTATTTRFGFLDATTSADAVDGAYFEIPAGSFAVVGKTSNNSTRTTSATLTTLSVNTWYRFVIKVNRTASSIQFNVYDANGLLLSSQPPITTNIPTTAGREFGVGYISTNSGTTATALGWLDYQAVQFSALKPLVR